MFAPGRTRRGFYPRHPHTEPPEPAEPDPGPGWLRSRVLRKPYPRPNVAPCGRPRCLVCDRTTTTEGDYRCQSVDDRVNHTIEK
jgi:hypothetical protein